MAELLSRWREGLAKTSRTTFGRLASVLGSTDITDDVWEGLESLLIQADLGLETCEEIIRSLRDTVRKQGLTRSDQLRSALKAELRARLLPVPNIEITAKPWVVLVVGVNGSGKTTTVAKLGKLFQDGGHSVVLGAADTFRAAAGEQLRIWGDRLGADVIAGAPDSDPGAVAFQTVQAGQARGADIVLIDTAGRLQTRFNLMQELKKIRRVVGKAQPGAPHAVWLVLDATLGQNSLQQARAFGDAVQVTGVILAKLDSSAKGGMAFAIQRELGLPILFAGLGERMDDLQPFDPDGFIDGILAS
jgi:fused signal recognition particle receptor